MNNNKLGKNFIYQLSYQIVSYLVPLLVAPYIARVLGAELLGEYTYTNTIAYYFYIACMLGVETYGARVIASVQNDIKERSKAFFEIFSVQIFMTTIGTVAYVLYIILFSAEFKQLLLIQILYVSSSIFYIPWFFVGIEDFKNIAFRNIILKVGTAIAIFIFVNDIEDLWIYTLIMAGSFFVCNIIFWTQITSQLKLVKVSLFKALKKHIKPIVLLFVPQIGITLFMYMGKLMLGWWAPMNELGLYQNAEKIINIPIALLMSLGAVIMPRAANLYATGEKEKIVQLNSVSMSAFMILSIGCMFGLAAISNDFIPWYYGNEFVQCVVLMEVLSITIWLMGIENALQKQYLIPSGRDKIVAICMIIAAIVNIVIDAILIPDYGAMGVIWGSIIAHLSICIIEMIYVRKELPITKYIKNMFGYLCAGIIMYVFVKILARFKINYPILKILMEIGCGSIVYFISIIVVIKMMKCEEHNIFFEYILKYFKKFLHY